jgi:two-component system, NtrC family, sensor kinase
LRMFLHRQVNAPLEQLTNRMAEVEAGNLQTRVALGREDEIGQLGAHFNRMVVRLEQNNTENRALLTRVQQFNEELATRITQATQELVERNQELLRLQHDMDRVAPLAALGRITGAIAHELGTPLNTILGYSQLLAGDELPDGAQENVRIIETQARRMADIIRHYLSRTRDAARQYRQVDLNAIIRETLAILTPMFSQHHVTVTSTLDTSLPFLTGDSASLQRVFINLLKNALEAREGGGTISIVTRQSSPPETPTSGLVLTIRDTGTGVPPELLPQVFELFVTTKAPGKGTGLGLALCQEIIKAHGGTITMTSEVGKETSVNIFLPVIASASAADGVREEL